MQPPLWEQDLGPMKTSRTHSHTLEPKSCRSRVEDTPGDTFLGAFQAEGSTLLARSLRLAVNAQGNRQQQHQRTKAAMSGIVTIYCGMSDLLG